MENSDTYQGILDDIADRTYNKYDLMSFEDKIKIITIAKEIKEYVDNYLIEQYPIISQWANLDMISIILEETEPQLDFNRNFSKLMGGFCID